MSADLAVVEPRPPLRERKKAEARNALVEAALELFGQHGFSAVTVDAIADRAGVSRRTFFRYFATKEDVMFDRRAAQLAGFEAALASAAPGEAALDLLREPLAALAADYEANRRQILAERALFASARELQLRDLELDRAFEQAIAHALAARAPKGRKPAEDATRAARTYAAATMAVLRVLGDEWAESRGRLDLVATGLPLLERLEPLAPRLGGATRRAT